MSVTGPAANCCPPGCPRAYRRPAACYGLPSGISSFGSGYGRACHAQQFSVGTAWEQRRVDPKQLESRSAELPAGEDLRKGHAVSEIHDDTIGQLLFCAGGPRRDERREE
jgi:hypothetical protein